VIDHLQKTCPRHPFVSSLSPSLSPFGAAFTPWIFLWCPEQKVYPRSTPLHSTQNFLSNKSLFAQIRLRRRDLRPFYFGDEICPEISERATLNVFSITPCTGLQIRWFLMRWNGNLMELPNISFFFICTPLNKLSNWWRQQHQSRDLERFMIYLATLLGMTSFLIIWALSTWLVKIGPSHDMCFF
jgi:hypothetical protein